MPDPHPPSVGALLGELRAGNQAAFDDLLPLVYDELHRLAERQRRLWQGAETLNTTALVHEAYLKLSGQSAPEWRSHVHFLRVASIAMRQRPRRGSIWTSSTEIWVPMSNCHREVKRMPRSEISR